MVDHHVHIENQEYSLQTIENIVSSAIKNNISEVFIVDHTHKFDEFRFLYKNTIKETKEFYDNLKTIPIKLYLDFITLVKKQSYPVKLNFGLEVCYFHSLRKELKKELDKYNFDFLIGSIHHVDNIAYDIKKSYLDGIDINKLYKHYYRDNIRLVKSKMFSYLAHPDAIKRFHIYPTYDLTKDYEKLAKTLKKYNMPTENNSGFVRYNFEYLGMNDKLYNVLKKYDVTIYKSSDAHTYEYVGYDFDNLKD